MAAQILHRKYKPPPRAYHAAFTFCDRLFIWGGKTESKGSSKGIAVLPSLDVFDTKKEEWLHEQTRGSLPQECFNTACAQMGEEIYCIGGIGKKSLFGNTLTKLNLKTYLWKEIRPARRPEPKAGSKMVTFDDKLVVFAGMMKGVQLTNNINIFDTNKCE